MEQGRHGFYANYIVCGNESKSVNVDTLKDDIQEVFDRHGIESISLASDDGGIIGYRNQNGKFLIEHTVVRMK